MSQGGVRALPLATIAVLLVSGLAGCVFATNSPASTAAVAPTASAPSNTSPVGSKETPASEHPTAASAECAPVELYEAWSADKPLLATLGGNRLRVPTDQGPDEFASGEVTLDDSGRPVAYTVAAGDTWSAVADRFCLHPDYINALNQVRRNRAFELYVGDTLNLSPYTVTSVGSENGQVFANPAPDPLPPQR
jgi:LysM repeat protein